MRTYKPGLVLKEILTELMEVALRAPSWANTQTSKEGTLISYNGAV